MTMIDTVRPQFLALPKQDQLQLAAEVLADVPLEDDDDGVAEAMRRIEESHRDPSVVISKAELLAGVAARRSK